MGRFPHQRLLLHLLRRHPQCPHQASCLSVARAATRQAFKGATWPRASRTSACARQSATSWGRAATHLISTVWRHPWAVSRSRGTGGAGYGGRRSHQQTHQRAACGRTRVTATVRFTTPLRCAEAMWRSAPATHASRSNGARATTRRALLLTRSMTSWPRRGS